MQLKETEEEYLYKLLFDETEFFLDAEKDKRFFMLHSSERSKATDTNIDRLLKYMVL